MALNREPPEGCRRLRFPQFPPHLLQQLSLSTVTALEFRRALVVADLAGRLVAGLVMYRT